MNDNWTDADPIRKSSVDKLIQVAQLSPRDRAAAWVSCSANINVVLRIQRTLL